ncbi:MAG: glycosyltransferase family 4 protein [Candidatus Zipacnadales bacterium]
MSERASLIHVVRPSQGGIQTHVVGLASRLPSRFQQIVAGALTREFQIALSRRLVPWVGVEVPEVPSFSATRRAAKQLGKLIAARRADIVHAHGYTAGITAAWALRTLHPRPALVITAHVSPFRQDRGWGSALARRLALRWLLGQIDRGIAVSETIRTQVIDWAPEAADRWETIHNGIDRREFRRRIDPGAKRRELGLDPSAAIVGVVARLSEEKGVDVFLRAAALLSENIPNIDFVVIGDGPKREALEDLAHALRLTGQVVFLGRRSDIPEVLSVLDVLVVPSREESFGLAALEGVAAGVPTIASDVGGLREVLGDTEAVLLVTPDDAEALAEALRRELNTIRPNDDPNTAVDLVDGNLMSLAEMLVSETEFDLDREGLEATPQPHARRPHTERDALLDRFDIQHMVHKTAALYDRLLAERSA